MKILHFLDTVNRGGAETLVLDVCRNARANDLDVIFAAAGGGGLEQDFIKSGADFFRLKRRLPFDLFTISSLRRIIVKNKIDIVHTHQAVEALHALAASFGTRVKVVLTHHGIVTDRKNLLALKFLLPRVDCNILVGKASRKSYETGLDFVFPPNTTVIYNGVDERRLQPIGKNLREELNISAGTFLIGMVGNFYKEPRKDQMTLCRALPKVFAEMPGVRCVFVGKIEEGAEDKFAECAKFCEENRINDRVHFLGARDDVPDILAALDLFVFSSLKEGLPIALNEAMLAGVPAIVSDIEPLLEASGNGKYAEVFPVGNAFDLSEKILNLLKNEALRNDLSARARDFAKNNFSIEAHLREIGKLYKSLIGE